MPRVVPILLIALTLANAACSSILYRNGQATVIGDVRHGTPTHVVIANSEGQQFRIPRQSVSGTRLGGLRTILWSPLTGYGLLLMAPLGVLQWVGDVNALDSTDGGNAALLDVPFEEEVDAGPEPHR